MARWAHVLQPAVDTAYSAGAATVGAGRPGRRRAPGAALELSTAVVAPLRERLGDSLEQIDARTPADTEIAVAQSLGARYREWRGEPLEGALGDAMAVAWSRGRVRRGTRRRAPALGARGRRASAPTATTTRSNPR